MSAPITIRPAAAPADLAAAGVLFRIYAEYLQRDLGFQHICMADHEREIASLPGRYAAPDGTLLLALVNDEPAGCVALQRVPDAQLLPGDATAAELKRLFVLPRFRGHTLGLRLAESAIAHARLRAYHAIYLDTVPAHMPHAAALYAALGFLPAPSYNANPDEGVRHLRLALQG